MSSPKSKPRILFAGYEIGGQMQLMAETLRSRGYHAKALSFNTDFRDFRTDLSIGHQKFPLNRLIFTLKALNEFDVFHFFWGVSLLDWWRFYGLDLALLKVMKKKIVVHFRGTDLINLDHYLSNEQAVNRPPKSTPIQQRKLKHWRKYADRILVSTPNLLDVAGEDSLVVPQVIDLKEWKATGSRKAGSTISIAHAPTRRGIKGTDDIIRSVDELKGMGLPVELTLVEKVKYQEVKNILEQADIGIDQLLLGWYGKVAVEFMALGKPVVSNIDSRYSEYQSNLPVIHATTATLTEVLTGLVQNEALRRKIGEQSVDYARQYHDVEKVVDDLIDLYASL